MMRIGLVIYDSLDTLSGGYLYDRKLVEYLRAKGDTVEVFSLPWRNYPSHLLDNLRFRLPLGLDVLIQDELNHPSLILANKAAHPYPVISLVHHLRSSEQHHRWQGVIYRFVEQHYLKSVDGFIFNSETTKAVVEDMVGGEKPNVVAYPPTDRFGVAVTEQEIIDRSSEPGPLRLLFLGNVIPRKGLHTLLEGVQAKPFDYCLDVVGSLDLDPRYARKMQQFASSTSTNSQIHFHGAIGDEKLFALLQSAHVLVVPSEYEGFGIVYLEGMAFGLPAVATNAGGATEIIQDGETGFLVSPGDVVSLADRLRQLADDRALLLQMSLNALRRYRQQPSWKETANRARSFLKIQVNTFDRDPKQKVKGN